MASMQKGVITMLFTRGYCYAHTAEKQDTSTRIAGNDNIRKDESLKGGTHLIRKDQIGDGTLSTSHPLSGRTSIPDGCPLLRASTS